MPSSAAPWNAISRRSCNDRKPSPIRTGIDPIRIQVDYPIYIRFLDMKRKGNHRIYNRQLWGMIYRETLPELRYGFTESIRQEIEAQLQGLFPE